MKSLEPRAKLYLSSDQIEGIFGAGKWRLLKMIGETGSLQDAAKECGMSYRKAWGDIKRAESGLGCSLVIRTRGGKNGGNTILTEYGRELIGAWELYRSEVIDLMGMAYRRHLEPLVDRR